MACSVGVEPARWIHLIKPASGAGAGWMAVFLSVCDAPRMLITVEDVCRHWARYDTYALRHTHSDTHTHTQTQTHTHADTHRRRHTQGG